MKYITLLLPFLIVIIWYIRDRLLKNRRDQPGRKGHEQLRAHNDDLLYQYASEVESFYEQSA
ncbi:MAG: hypothetical protein D6748_08140, partial [Calditrichaeota bacterium]